MKTTLRALLAPIALLLLVTAALAQNPVGTWKGKIKIDESKLKLPANATPEQQKRAKDGIANLKKLTATLVMKSDKTFVVTYAGGPKGMPNKTEGTWAAQGNKLTLTATKRDGKPVTGQEKRPQTLVISKDGKSMTIQERPGAPVTMVFTK